MIPKCPPYTTKLWDGYSYLAAQASSKTTQASSEAAHVSSVATQASSGADQAS